jgi:hypothetical protein
MPYIVTRTQIYLSDEQAAALERAARAAGKTKSQLIREAIDRTYFGGADSAKVLSALQLSAGAWRRREAGAAYVERMRSGRLARLGLGSGE